MTGGYQIRSFPLQKTRCLVDSRLLFERLDGGSVTDTGLRRPQNDADSISAWEKVERPLESVVGLAEMLSDRSRDVSAAARTEMIEQLAIRAQTVQHAVRNIILAAHLGDGEVEYDNDTVELRELVEGVAQEWSLAAHGGRITVSGSVDAIGDAVRVARVLRNIVEDALARGGRNIDVRIAERYSKVVVEIDDDGREIPGADLQAISAPYHRRLAAEWEGSVLGLGVAVARGLAKGMGGDLRCFRAGRLNSFELTLRRKSQTTSRRRQLSSRLSRPADSQPTRDELTEIIDEQSISMVYQSIVDFRGPTAQAMGYESFARFPYAAPPSWFTLAASSGLGLDLELLAIELGIAGFEASDDGAFLALNLSNNTLLAPRLAAALEGIDPGRLVLELSDTARIRSYEITRRAVESLRERGVRLAVDDVGAGEIDMWHILRLDPEIVKLDRHLVADQQNIRRNNALIKGLTTMARDLGIMVIAEAIETEAERQRLLELGVEFGQGYLFGKPQPLQWKSRVLGGETDT